MSPNREPGRSGVSPRRDDEAVDIAVEDSFPASDPPCFTSSTTGAPVRDPAQAARNTEVPMAKQAKRPGPADPTGGAGDIGGVQGEGNREADRRYREGAKRFAESGRVKEAAREAADELDEEQEDGSEREPEPDPRSDASSKRS